MLNVNIENIKVVFRASRVPGKYVLCLVKCLSLQCFCLYFLPFLSVTSNKCTCYESRVPCAAGNIICCLSVCLSIAIFSVHIQLNISVTVCYQLTSIKVATQTLAMNVTRNAPSSDCK
jgi:hypothetical protein